MGNKDLVWLTIQGIDKREILEGMGFKINDSGILLRDGKEVRALDNPELAVKANDVKAILPGSLTEPLMIITDVSELEALFGNENDTAQ